MFNYIVNITNIKINMLMSPYNTVPLTLLTIRGIPTGKLIALLLSIAVRLVLYVTIDATVRSG